MGLPDTAEQSFMLTADDTVVSVSELYHQAWSGAVLVAVDWDLDDLALHNRRGPVSLRWISLHLIRELARGSCQPAGGG